MRCPKFGPGIRSHMHCVMHNAGRDCEYEVCRMGGAESLKLEPRMCHYAQLLGGAPGPNAQEQHALRADIMVGGIFSETDNRVIDNRTANYDNFDVSVLYVMKMYQCRGNGKEVTYVTSRNNQWTEAIMV